jgi:hypothetical protein
MDGNNKKIILITLIISAVLLYFYYTKKGGKESLISKTKIFKKLTNQKFTENDAIPALKKAEKIYGTDAAAIQKYWFGWYGSRKQQKIPVRLESTKKTLG